jgi:hypothetical protein
MNRALQVALFAGLTGVASAQNFNLGNLIVTDEIQGYNLNGASVPAGAYTSYSVTVDWVAGAGDPWSSDAIFALTRDDIAGGFGSPTFYADPGAAPNSAGNGSSVTLVWNGFLDAVYNGGDSLWFNTLQIFLGSDAIWGNVSISLGNDLPVAPSSIDLGVLGVAGDFDITTFGSDFDTELGLYNALGGLIANNDDEDGPTLQSQIIETLAEGTYYIAVGGFNSSFAGDFGATGGNAAGNLVLNVNGDQVAGGATTAGQIQWYSFQVVPTPASASLLAFGGLLAARRRR